MARRRALRRMLVADYCRSSPCSMGLGLAKEESADELGVLPSGMGGGPMGLGDPADRTLRSVEINTLIPELIRERLRTEPHLCLSAWEEFGACSKKHGSFSFYHCRDEVKRIRACHNDKFEQIRPETTEMYLQMRAHYRRTGVGHPIRRKNENRDRWFTLDMAEQERRLHQP